MLCININTKTKYCNMIKIKYYNIILKLNKSLIDIALFNKLFKQT